MNADGFTLWVEAGVGPGSSVHWGIECRSLEHCGLLELKTQLSLLLSAQQIDVFLASLPVLAY